MLAKQYPYYLANQAVQANQDLTVTNKFTGEPVTQVAQADEQALDTAIEAAVQARAAMAAIPSHQRRDILSHCVEAFRQRYDELAHSLCIEAGKPIKDAKGEVDRLIDTFVIAAEEATRIGGEVIPLDIAARTENYRGMYKRVPIGPCAFISPFNFPLNLVAHKVAPAIAAGCPFVLKPASYTPIGALIIGEILAETELPKGAFSILPMTRDAADALTTDARLKLLSFTGSPEVGWKLKANAGHKPVVLELGGNAACVVTEDADLADTTERLITGGFYQSGQSCISVQRVIIHESIYQPLKQRMIEATEQLVMGDPSNDDTFIGPMIAESEAKRLEGWLDKAVAAGATLLCGGQREGNMFSATLVESVPTDTELYREEAFGPIMLLEPYRDYQEALAKVNNSDYGLQAGVFTRDIERINQAWDELEVGGVVINDVPSWRVDHMPYGGVKASGLGREGLKYAISDMTEIRLLAIRSRH